MGIAVAFHLVHEQPYMKITKHVFHFDRNALVRTLVLVMVAAAL